ncbi:unnamed protein product [Ostreobium quekettii]|uniref:1,4-dihydroxy-2-naphthoate phytyltransferase n=1 Tax=Ostreobium quekettii TaxID=121088 RepID=A0A8S1INC7_9CHLO|nr:unnamed protein product [Ostreobium quekettii]
MYWVAAIPVLLGAALAFCEAGAVSIQRTGGFLVAAVLIIAWLNLSNDFFDSETGVDENKNESVVNLTGKPNMVFLTSLAFLGVGVGLLGWLLAGSGAHQSAVLLAAAIACGYVYQGPPFRLGYIGLGEPLCFLAFGPLAVQAFSLALRPQVFQHAVFSAASWWTSILVGLTTTMVLFCSHFHQLEGDRAVGKMSPIVRLGSTGKAHHVLRWSVFSVFVMAATGVFLGHLPWTVVAVLPFCTPQARALLAFAAKHYSNPERIRPLKLYALNLHSALGLALAVALAASRVKLQLGI